MDGKQAIDALVKLLVPTRDLRPTTRDLFAREQRKIEQLTRQQFKILSILRYQQRAAIIGGAETGKTLLAIEKATQLVENEMRVLFLCFNKNLADWIDQRLRNPNVMVSTYHGMVGRARHWAGLAGSGRRMKWNEFTEQAPEQMLDALSIIRAPGGNSAEILFDALIVDEAQDFEDSWWIPIPDWLKDPDKDLLYVFFDDNQRIFTQIQ